MFGSKMSGYHADYRLGRNYYGLIPHWVSKAWVGGENDPNEMVLNVIDIDGVVDFRL